MTHAGASLYLPDGPGPLPCLVMGHGFTGTQDQLEPYARRIAADDPSIAAVVVQVPVFDKSRRGLAREAREKMARERISLGSLLWVTLRSVAAGGYDALRGAVGRSPSHMPVFDAPGRVAALTDPDSAEHRALFERTGVSWRNEFTPRFLFHTPRYVEGTAERLRMPLHVCVAEHDSDADPKKAVDVARRAPHGELAGYPVRHFDVYTGDIREQLLHDQIEFLSGALRPGSAPVTAG